MPTCRKISSSQQRLSFISMSRKFCFWDISIYVLCCFLPWSPKCTWSAGQWQHTVMDTHYSVTVPSPTTAACVSAVKKNKIKKLHLLQDLLELDFLLFLIAGGKIWQLLHRSFNDFAVEEKNSFQQSMGVFI